MTERDAEAVLRFIERLAGSLESAGLPRMPARVFCALVTTDSARLTAAELADILHVSPAAVSGAVRYLTMVHMIGREREPGSRRDSYVVHGDVWYEATLRREDVIARWIASAREGVDVLGAGTPAGRRMKEMLAYFEFMQKEIPGLLERWREYRATLPL